jgi:hypothetical protein
MGYIGSGISRFNTADELTVTGDAEFNGNANFGDNDKAIFGAGSDLQIYHDGSHSYVSDQGTGNIKILADDFILKNSADTETMIQAFTDASVSLWYNNSSKLVTTATGVDVTGVITTDGMTTSADINFGDNDKAVFGAGSDLQIYHDGLSSHIVDNGTGDLRMQGVVQVTDNPSSNDGRILFGDSTVASGIVHYDFSAGDFLFENTWANSAADFVFRTNSVDALTVSPTGIDVTGTVTADGLNVEIPDNNSGPVTIQQGGNSYFKIVTTNTSESVQLGNSTTNPDVLLGSGNVGISNTAPDFNLSVGNSSSVNPSIQIISATNSNAQLLFGDGAGAAGYRGTVVYGNATDSMLFSTAGSERMRLDDSANFLVGASSLNDTNGFTVFPTGSGSATMVRIDRSSNGTALQFRQGQSPIGTVSTTTSGVTYNTTSDRRLKSNIQDAASASAKIDAIQVRQFDWNADDSHQDYGLIAQELQPIEPMAVTGNADSDEMMGVDYSKLVPMLIKEIQELRSRVATLEAN